MSDLTQRLRAATEGVTPGPWEIERGKDLHMFAPDPHGTIMSSTPYEEWTPDDKDWPFIAAARTLIPEAADALDAKDAEIAALADDIGRALQTITELSDENERLREAIQRALDEAVADDMDEWFAGLRAALAGPSSHGGYKDGDQISNPETLEVTHRYENGKWVPAALAGKE